MFRKSILENSVRVYGNEILIGMPREEEGLCAKRVEGHKALPPTNALSVSLSLLVCVCERLGAS